VAFTDLHLFFDDVQVGQEWESQGRTVTESDIVNFAGLSGDFNPIHMDHEFAKKTVFRKPIAHGLLVLSMGSGLGLMFPPMRTLAFIGIKDWKFLDPVNIGDTIRARAKVLEKEERSRGRRGVVTWQRQIVNQHNKLVQEGVTVTLVEGRGRRDLNSRQPAVGRDQESGVRSQESAESGQE
jgi:3-hydroxybutyryl-CoA dehydratase